MSSKQGSPPPGWPRAAVAIDHTNAWAVGQHPCSRSTPLYDKATATADRPVRAHGRDVNHVVRIAPDRADAAARVARRCGHEAQAGGAAQHRHRPGRPRADAVRVRWCTATATRTCRSSRTDRSWCTAIRRTCAARASRRAATGTTTGTRTTRRSNCLGCGGDRRQRTLARGWRSVSLQVMNQAGVVTEKVWFNFTSRRAELPPAKTRRYAAMRAERLAGIMAEEAQAPP